MQEKPPGEPSMDEGAPFAGANQPMTALSAGSRGTSQSGVGLYNERLILSLIRRQRSLAGLFQGSASAASPQ